MIHKVAEDQWDNTVALNDEVNPRYRGVAQRATIGRPSGRQSPRVEARNRLSFAIADRRDEIYEAFRLVYSVYLNSQLIEPNPHEIRVTPYHAQPSADVFIAVDHEEVVGTMSLIGDSHQGLPMEDVYPEEVGWLRGTGTRLAEVCSLAQKYPRRPTLMRLINLMSQRARHRGIDELLIAVHPRHVRFYRDFLSFETFGPERTYAAVCDHPAVAMRLNLTHLHESDPRAYQRMFGEPFAGWQLASVPRSSEIQDQLSWLAAETYASQKYQVV